MDSLTQIVLGAAVGEIVLGKKIGNRAMAWGAIGATIPDLDIIGNLFMGEVEALAFHRGISHSFFFSLLSPFLFAWFVKRWYTLSFRSKRWFPMARWSLYLLLYLFLMTIVVIICYFFSPLGGLMAIGTMTVFGYFTFNSKYQNRILESDFKGTDIPYKNWYWLFFWVIFTHILLDIFTTYGTQALLPFSNIRLAFSAISVVDPLYTVPFLVTLIRASFFKNHFSRRRQWIYAGLIISSGYLLWTVYNKRQVDYLHQSQLISERLDFNRTFSSPTIFNNIVWHLVAEQDSQYIVSDFGLLDSLSTLKHVRTIPKNHVLLHSIHESYEIQTLKWFSDEYYTIEPMDSQAWKYCDLRYGTGIGIDDCVFSFEISKVPGEDSIMVVPNRGADQDIRESLQLLWKRIKGI